MVRLGLARTSDKWNLRLGTTCLSHQEISRQLCSLRVSDDQPPRADADALIDIEDEDVSVAMVTGVRAVQDDASHFFRALTGGEDINDGDWEQRTVGVAAKGAQRGVLPPALRHRHRYAVHARPLERGDHRVDLVFTNHGAYELGHVTPLSGLTQSYFEAGRCSSSARLSSRTLTRGSPRKPN